MGFSIQRPKEFEGVVKQTHEFDCEPSAAVGDLVRHDPGTDNFARVAVDNTEKQPIIGYIIEKPSPTRCIAMLEGELDYAIDRGRLYLSAGGQFTVISPDANYLQVLGESFGDGKIYFSPSGTVLKKN